MGSDDGFDVVKKQKNQNNSLEDQIECVRVILENIISIPTIHSSFSAHIQSHRNLMTDLLKTHITTTNNMNLLSLLYICIDLLIKNKSDIGLLCFDRIANLSICYDSGFNINDNNDDDDMNASINKKSLRLLTSMVTVYGSHLFSLMRRPLNHHLNPINDRLQGGAILQIAKLYETNDGTRKIIDNEWKLKQKLYDMLIDRDNDNNYNIHTIQNVLFTLSEMAMFNGCGSILKYA